MTSVTPTRVVILGSTGSIGTSTLKVLSAQQQAQLGATTQPKQITGLFANSSVSKLVAQVKEHQPRYCGVFSLQHAQQLKDQLAQELSPQQLQQLTVVCGEDAIIELLSSDQVDMVMGAIVGFAGVRTSLATLNAGKTLLLANKETLVTCGHLIAQALANNKQAKLIPVDSEHNAIFQALDSEQQRNICFCDLTKAGVRQLILTASGGPFLRLPLTEFSNITPAQALKHPNWAMGAKVTIDSSTLMNKGLEFIEAAVLYNCPASMIKTIIHPQSIVHSGVEYLDGSMVVQMGPTDMCVPIAYALNYPARDIAGVAPLELSKLSGLTFEEVDLERYPNFKLAQQALEQGPIVTCALNAANEITVAAFLAGTISYQDIYRLNAAVMAKVPTLLKQLPQKTTSPILTSGQLFKDLSSEYDYSYMQQLDQLVRQVTAQLLN